MSDIKTVEIVKILPTKVWVESDFFGSQHIMIQHEDMHPFQWMTINYDYAYTSNSTNDSLMNMMLKSINQNPDEIERKLRPLSTFSLEEKK